MNKESEKVLIFGHHILDVCTATGCLLEYQRSVGKFPTLLLRFV